MAIYNAPKPWQGRNDGDDANVQRWHQAIELINLDQPINQPISQSTKIAFIGFCSDEGVLRNQGRVGAKDGPVAIRKACSSFPVHFEKLELFDAGDVVCDDGDLEAAQSLLGEKIQQLISRKYTPIVLGGGHEVAYGNFNGIKQKLSAKSNFGVINIDAHFDLRQVDEKVGVTSGTGFWQMASHCKENKIGYHYLAIGIQDCSNTKLLFDTARNIGALYIKAEEFTNDQLEHILDLLNHVLEESDTVQLSIDMDAFTAANAPGVSAPAFNGMPPNSMFRRLLRHIVFSGKVASIDIAELNPLYDVDNRTARLAASFVFDMVQALERG
ncbi:MAG: formimidoylglutamase [Bacteroidota bacterium]